MKNEFVPYKIAVKLKEIGFDEPCLAWYYGPDLWMVDQKEAQPINSRKGSIRGGNGVLAPTRQSALSWFREKHGLWVSFRYDDCDCVEKDVCWYVDHSFSYGIGPLFITNKLNDFATLEEAEIGCIGVLVDIVKNGPKHYM